MLREPAAPLGMAFNEVFVEEYRRLQLSVPALHDGAILVAVNQLEKNAFVTHWSCRLFPPPMASAHVPNRGSAYHSAIEFSCVKGVLAVAACSGGTIVLFVDGREVAI